MEEQFVIYLDGVKEGIYRHDDALDREEVLKIQNPNLNVEVVEVATCSI